MTIDVVLFDLGGVLFDYAGMAGMRALTDMATDEDVARRWLASEWVRRFESGRCTPGEFCAGMLDEWGIRLAPDEFLRRFADWVVAPYEGAPGLVREVAAAVRVGCLSNTNETHWSTRISTWPLVDAFDPVFLSFEIGAVKPDPDVFDHVVRALDADPAAILFLDDTPANVDAAAGAGLTARRVRGVAGARQALADAGVLAGGSAGVSPSAAGRSGRSVSIQTAR